VVRVARRGRIGETSFDFKVSQGDAAQRHAFRRTDPAWKQVNLAEMFGP
jgi:hypothetical protein